jgi:hypothetical protein
MRQLKPGSAAHIAADFRTRFTKKKCLIPLPIQENQYAIA